jgi:hypothetical protein
MFSQIHLSGSYIDNINRTSLKFSLIKCVNTTVNSNHCKSNETIDLFMANTIIEMRLIGKALNSNVNEDKLVEQ